MEEVREYELDGRREKVQTDLWVKEDKICRTSRCRKTFGIMDGQLRMTDS